MDINHGLSINKKRFEIATLDASVLVGSLQRNFLLSFADKELFHPQVEQSNPSRDRKSNWQNY